MRIKAGIGSLVAYVMCIYVMTTAAPVWAKALAIAIAMKGDFEITWGK